MGYGWGKEEWGLGRYGGVTLLPGLSLINARAISTKEIELTLSRECQVLGSTVPGDGLNPDTWVLQRLDTGDFFSILNIRQTGPVTLVFQVLQDFGPAATIHRLSTTTLLDSDGNPILPSPLNQADFAGMLSTVTKSELVKANTRSGAVKDIANPPLPAIAEGTAVGGTLVINSGGDYELESGAALLKKLIIRRLITTPGDFFHLPDYGIGLKVKDAIPAANLIKLRTEVIRQVLREPEIQEANCTIVMASSGEVLIKVTAKMRATGEALETAVTATPQGIVF